MKHAAIGKLEYSKITKNIYVGTNMCCQNHFDEMLLKKEGIEADVSLEKERIDHPFGVSFYLWLPIEDTQAPTQEQFEVGISFLEKLINLDKKVYVHCQNGHGRAPTLVAAYFIKQGKTIKEAISFFKTKRPSVHLSKIQKQALINLLKV